MREIFRKCAKISVGLFTRTQHVQAIIMVIFGEQHRGKNDLILCVYAYE